ncbi:hypothetical protein CP532_1155 [Ophiocordyceps camponoti-leonardi (nom. inval.)]|nr:hypothetical protein CP532_1155 [Ophiocordyceps camponoti-leonardi (nom. inval.)]
MAVLEGNGDRCPTPDPGCIDMSRSEPKFPRRQLTVGSLMAQLYSHSNLHLTSNSFTIRNLWLVPVPRSTKLEVIPRRRLWMKTR